MTLASGHCSRRRVRSGPLRWPSVETIAKGTPRETLYRSVAAKRWSSSRCASRDGRRRVASQARGLCLSFTKPPTCSASMAPRATCLLARKRRPPLSAARRRRVPAVTWARDGPLPQRAPPLEKKRTRSAARLCQSSRERMRSARFFRRKVRAVQTIVVGRPGFSSRPRRYESSFLWKICSAQSAGTFARTFATTAVYRRWSHAGPSKQHVAATPPNGRGGGGADDDDATRVFVGGAGAIVLR
mmetsp:Transcript_20303/g.65405  ORF Transcript_20303/g.65405 Transcript_20303/m.65405 type:complete len:243 (+) Transcript_20303:231-959(+)